MLQLARPRFGSDQAPQLKPPSPVLMIGLSQAFRSSGLLYEQNIRTSTSCQGLLIRNREISRIGSVGKGYVASVPTQRAVCSPPKVTSGGDMAPRPSGPCDMKSQNVRPGCGSMPIAHVITSHHYEPMRRISGYAAARSLVVCRPLPDLLRDDSCCSG